MCFVLCCLSCCCCCSVKRTVCLSFSFQVTMSSLVENNTRVDAMPQFAFQYTPSCVFLQQQQQQQAVGSEGYTNQALLMNGYLLKWSVNPANSAFPGSQSRPQPALVSSSLRLDVMMEVTLSGAVRTGDLQGWVGLGFGSNAMAGADVVVAWLPSATGATTVRCRPSVCLCSVVIRCFFVLVGRHLTSFLSLMVMFIFIV